MLTLTITHHPPTRSHQFLRFVANAILWVTRNINESRYTHDVFLSFSHEHRVETGWIRDREAKLGLNIFMPARTLGVMFGMRLSDRRSSTAEKQLSS
jgi:hypothetical protein